jgi:16S rRNA (cytosine967-C5)-methyltransferase
MFDEGVIEVQDAGSQIVGLAIDARAGERIVDLCAGAGGKTLAMAAAMQGEGDILACDTDRARLQRLSPRAERAGVTIVEARLLNPGREKEALEDWRGQADGVLVDAPCSGTGTWRRNPEARWRLTPDRLDRVCATQCHVLDTAARLVRPGGRLIYIVCSLLDAEGADQIEAFIDRYPNWRVERPTLPAGCDHRGGVRLTPASDGTDGFFVARLIAPC